MILIDSREPKNLQKAVIAMVEDANVQMLPVGDFLIYDKCGHITAVERKNIADLLGSIADRRVYRQVRNLKQFDRSILLVEGAWDVSPKGKIIIGARETGWFTSSVQMLLLSFQQKTGVMLIYAPNKNETPHVLKALVKQGQKDCVLT